MNRNPILPILAGIFLFGGALLGVTSFYIVDPGHTGVQVLGGNVVGQVDNGWGFVNPLSSIEEFDCRQKTMDFKGTTIRAKDQLETHFDISVQYNAVSALAAEMYENTGNLEAVVSTHLVPKFRSVARDSGRTVEDSKQFFVEDTQNAMTGFMLDNLQTFCAPKGINVTAVLIRSISPPEFIEQAVQRREEREQETDRQRAELERFEIEQQQKVAAATAERDAALLQAESIRNLAQAEADAVRMRGEAIAANPEVLRLEYIQAWDGVLPRMMMGENADVLIPVTDTGN